MTTDPQPITAPKYKDEDLVYVDPETRTVVGLVEWGKNDKPKSLPYTPIVVPGKEGDVKKQFWRKFFPWGTYRSMKRIYKVEGKIKDPEPNKSFDEVLPKALSTAFWTWDEKEKKSEVSDQ